MLIGAMAMSGFILALLAYLLLTSSFNIPTRPLSTQPNTADLPAPLLEVMDLLDPSEAAAIPDVEPLPQLASNDRITVLVMGVDRRPGESFATRTDTMIVLSLDPENGTASMLSIPRDLYVEIPGVGRQRINTALPYGAYNGGEAAGAALVAETLNYNLGINIDHYAMLDFQTVIDVVDAVGGLTIDVPYDINDPTYPDMNYGYDPLFIPAGTQTMDGALALKYMRTRHADGDFNRSKRQQQMILAFREAVLADGLASAAGKIRTIYSEVREGVVTDLSITDMLSLANAASIVDRDSIQSAVLDSNYVTDFTTASGAYVLIPRTAEIATLVQELFN